MMQDKMVRFSATLPAQQPRRAGTPPLPLDDRRARVVNTSPRSLILTHCPNGTGLDIVESVDGDTLRLASGGTIDGRSVIAPASVPIPRALPYWSGPGASLWEVVANHFIPDIRQQVEAHPGVTLSRNLHDRMIASLFKTAESGSVVVAGRPLPLQAEAHYIQFDPRSQGFW
jgi:hypothetical protein